MNVKQRISAIRCLKWSIRSAKSALGGIETNTNEALQYLQQEQQQPFWDNVQQQQQQQQYFQ